MTPPSICFTAEARNANEVPRLLAEAYAAFNSPRPGPVHLSLPLDIMQSTIEPTDWRHYYRQQQRPTPSPSAIDQVAQTLAKARRPLLLLGRGCAGARAEMRRLIDAWDLPFCTSLQGKGVAYHDSPWNLGVVGTAGSPRANAWIKECDLLLVVGSSLNEFTTGVYTHVPRDGMTLLRVDIDPAAARSHIPADLDICADAREFFTALADHPPQGDRAFEADLHGLCATLPFFVETPVHNTGVPGVTPMDVVRFLQENAPADAIFVGDAGNNAAWISHCLRLRGEQEFYIDINTGCMGSGVTSAIGLQCAHPNRRVVSVCGDGGMFMLGNEVSTAVEHSIPVVWLVFNDSKLGMIRQGSSEVYGVEITCRFSATNLSTWAKGLGATVLRVETAEALAAALKETLNQPVAGGPVVFDVMIDDSYLPNFYPRAKRRQEEEPIHNAVQRALAARRSSKQEHSPTAQPIL
jgi:acetolactate synthase-1/2/3 large subunit